MSEVAILTPEQLKSFAGEVAAAIVTAQQPTQTEKPNDTNRYVYGLRGIEELFNVCHTTAQKYKNTFLAPAVKQRGRKIIVDVKRAWELYHQKASV